jgi:hypothetical protein
MKQSIISLSRRSIWWTLCLVLACTACHHREQTQVIPVSHLLSISQGGATLYIDRLDNRAVLAHADTTGPTTFCSFLVGWQDSLAVTDAKRTKDWEKYLQYTMPQDWTALVAGDSVKPVFFQEKPHLSGQGREGALVFEISRSHRADTLIYRDHFGQWGTQIFVLNEKHP